MPQAHFDALAAGFGDADSIAHLIKAQRSERRTLLRLLRERAANGAPLFRAGWELLDQPGQVSPPRSTRCSRTRTCGPGRSAVPGAASARRAADRAIWRRSPPRRRSGRAPRPK